VLIVVQVLLVTCCDFGLNSWKDVDSAGSGRCEGTGDLLEGLVPGLWHIDDDEKHKEDQQADEHDERVRFQFHL